MAKQCQENKLATVLNISPIQGRVAGDSSSPPVTVRRRSAAEASPRPRSRSVVSVEGNFRFALARRYAIE